jgi:hypothetical protein
MQLKPKPGEVKVVDRIPNCDFNCPKPGPYDFATKFGPWAHGCADHYEANKASEGLGVAKAQIWITKDQVES